MRRSYAVEPILSFIEIDIADDLVNHHTALTTLRMLRPFTLLGLIFVLVGCLFAYELFYQGGRDAVTPDGIRYLAAAQGEKVDLPYNSRIAGPMLAKLITGMTGASVRTAFILETAGSLLASLLLLVYLLEKRAAPFSYEVGFIAAFGSALAVFYGSYPVLVDGLLLLLSCLIIVALDRDLLLLGLVGVCIAGLTKEYGLLLALPWAAHVIRRRHRIILAIGGSLLPCALLIGAALVEDARPGVYPDYRSFVSRQLIYQAFWLYPEYLLTYLRSAYLLAWGAMWPILAFAAFVAAARLVRRSDLCIDDVRYLAILLAAPVLLLGDWDRTFLVAVPFACAAAVSHRFAQYPLLGSLLGVGGVTTSLLRAYYISRYSGVVFPTGTRITLVTVSLAATLTLMIACCRVSRGSRASRSGGLDATLI